MKKKVREYLIKEMRECWDKMGNTGSYKYMKDCTKLEIMYYGRFFAYEAIWNMLFQNDDGWTRKNNVGGNGSAISKGE